MKKTVAILLAILMTLGISAIGASAAAPDFFFFVDGNKIVAQANDPAFEGQGDFTITLAGADILSTLGYTGTESSLDLELALTFADGRAEIDYTAFGAAFAAAADPDFNQATFDALRTAWSDLLGMLRNVNFFDNLVFTYTFPPCCDGTCDPCECGEACDQACCDEEILCEVCSKPVADCEIGCDGCVAENCECTCCANPNPAYTDVTKLDKAVKIYKGFNKKNADYFENLKKEYPDLTFAAAENNMFTMDANGKIAFEKTFASLINGKPIVTATNGAGEKAEITVTVVWAWYEYFLVILAFGFLWI